MSQRRLALLTLLAALPLGVLAVALLVLGYRAEQRQLTEQRLALARTAAVATEAFVAGNLSTLASVALMPEVTDPASPGLKPLLSAIVATNPDWQGLTTFGADGWNLQGAGTALPRTINIADRPYFQQALQTREPVISPGLTGRGNGVPAIILAVPVEFQDGSRGVINANLPLNRLSASLREQLGAPDLNLQVVDRLGQIIADTNSGAVSLASVSERADVADVLAGRAATMTVAVEGTDQFVAYSPVNVLGGGVLVSQPAGRAFGPARDQLWTGLGFLGLLLTAIGTVAYLGVRRLAALYAAVAAGRERALFLASASQALSEAVEQPAGMQIATEIAVQRFAAMCIVDTVDERGDIVRTAARHREESLSEQMQVLEQYAPRAGGSAGAAHVIATGVAELIEVTPEHMTRIAQDERHLAALRVIGNRSLLIVPMQARGRTLGAVTFGRDALDPAYTPDDLLLAEDLADRIALALDNGRLHDDLTQALSTRDMFIASASHDLRSPLAVVIGVAQLIRRQLSRTGAVDPALIASRLEEAERAARRIDALVSAMLDLSALDAGHPLPLTRSDIDLGALARQVADDFTSIAPGREIEVRAPEAPVRGYWDEARLDRMLRNLVDNAVKYSPAGSAISITIEGGGPDQTDLAVISVRDSGVGIPAAELGHVFTRFFRGQAAAANTYGSGIGLASAQQVAQEHGGTIEAESVEGGGTTITVRLPLVPREHSPQPLAEAEAASPR